MSLGANIGSAMLCKAFKPETAIGKYLLTTVGAGDNSAKLALDGTAVLLGVSTDIDRAANDPFVDINLDGIVPVIYGAAISAGDAITAAAGKGIKAAAGENFIGIALTTGVSNDIGLILISRGKA